MTLAADWPLPGFGLKAVLARYQALRPRLPAMPRAPQPQECATLDDLADRFDGFLLDAYGVLNIGERAIPGAPARMAALRARGKRLVVLTNAASFSRPALAARYRALGFDFAPDDIVSSRDVAAAQLNRLYPGATWAAIAIEGDDFADIPARLRDAVEDPTAFDSADAILFLSTRRWTPTLQDRLSDALHRRPRPVVIANPDLVAPDDGGFTLEPGFFGHALQDALPLTMHWFGKPFPEAFAEAIRRTGLPANRLAMVGDTLHTDILGGAAAGCGTVLVADHGLFAGRAALDHARACAILPDYIIAST
jgi:HAD superfamily hydrolase (TIGR01450 family)